MQFVDPFFSGTSHLALNLSQKSHHMLNFLIKNERNVLVKNSLFWIKKMSFDDILMTTWEWQVKSQRKKKQQILYLGFNFFLFKKVKFYRFKKSINNNSTIFKGFFLSGSIKTFNPFEDFFFNVQFWIFVSEIWLEEFFKDAKQIFNYIDLDHWCSKKIS